MSNQTQQMCRDFLLEHCRGQTLEAIQAATDLRDRWGIRVGWPQMSDALEALEQEGKAVRVGTGADRMATYRVLGGE